MLEASSQASKLTDSSTYSWPELKSLRVILVSFQAYKCVVTQRSYPVSEERGCVTTQITAVKEVKEDWKRHICSLHGHSLALSNLA